MVISTKRTAALDAPTTLPGAVDLINDAEFYGRALPQRVRDAAVSAIVGRFGGESAYSGGFALTVEERAAGFRVFTGEAMTNAAARHIATEEATRALRLVGTESPEARDAAEEGNRRLLEGLMARVDAKADGAGVVCCGNCNVAAWRHLAAGGLNRPGERLPFAMRWLHGFRDGKGGWKRHPLHYTVLTLTEILERTDIATEAVRAELEYAAPMLERRLRRSPSGEPPYGQRRWDVMERALGLV